MFRNRLGVILKGGSRSAIQIAQTASRDIDQSNYGVHSSLSAREDKVYWVLVLTGKEDSLNGNFYFILEPLAMPLTAINIPKVTSYSLECLSFTTFTTISTKQIKVNGEQFVGNGVAEELLSLANQLKDLAKDRLVEFDWFRIKDLAFQEKAREKVILTNQLYSYQCQKCPDLIRHVIILSYFSMVFYMNSKGSKSK